MSKHLNVYLFECQVGILSQNHSGSLTFSYQADWLNNRHAIPLSQSLPLSNKVFSDKTCQAFFGGMLPEESSRKQLAKILGISHNNDFSMLSEIGGECAGAASFYPANTPYDSLQPSYQSISESELVQILNDLPQRPLGTGQHNLRLSLAGAQDKITVRLTKTKTGLVFELPLNGAASTHIFKPPIKGYKDSVYNEALCMMLAQSIGLNAANTQVLDLENQPVLSVTRYDRDTEEKSIKRVHQEDFCQALGVVSQKKYQNEGGVSLKQAFDLVRHNSSLPVIDLKQLLHVVIFNYFIGNNDAHGKNFSLTYQNGQTRLAPFYDLLCTAYYPELSAKMAMKIGSKYHPDDVYLRHFEQLAIQVGLSKPMVKKQIQLIATKTLVGLKELEGKLPNTDSLIQFIRTRVNTFSQRLI